MSSTKDRNDDNATPEALEGLLNPATTEVPVHPLIRHRWSPRVFSERPVSEEAIRSLLEAARWAPSSRNAQPWRFVVARRDDGEAHRRMVGMLTEGNQKWAGEAPVLMLSFANTVFDSGKENRVALHDVGQAVAQLTIEAVSRGLLVHQMAGIHLDRIVDAYEVPDDVVPVTGIAVGYPPDVEGWSEEKVEEHLKKRGRKEIGEIAFRGRFEGARE